MSKFERITVITGAFDKRHSEPSKNYGIHGMEIRFILKGEKGATQFVVYTPIHLPSVADDLYNKPHGHNPFHAMGADIGYHSKRPQYEGQDQMGDDCHYTDGPCYYDGSGLAADEFLPTFLEKGSEAVWPMLEMRYAQRFEAL